MHWMLSVVKTNVKTALHIFSFSILIKNNMQGRKLNVFTFLSSFLHVTTRIYVCISIMEKFKDVLIMCRLNSHMRKEYSDRYV